MRIRSDDLEPMQPIAQAFAFGKPGAHGEPVVHSANRNPHLAWSDVPAGTRSFALFCVDPDVPSRGDDVNQEGRHVPASLPRVEFFHWVMVDIPGECRELATASCADGVIAHGKNDPPGPPGLTSSGPMRLDGSVAGMRTSASCNVLPSGLEWSTGTSSVPHWCPPPQSCHVMALPAGAVVVLCCPDDDVPDDTCGVPPGTDVLPGTDALHDASNTSATIETARRPARRTPAERLVESCATRPEDAEDPCMVSPFDGVGRPDGAHRPDGVTHAT